MTTLKADGLTLWRGAHCLFEDLSFSVAAGTAAIVIGSNGSGKTTLLRVLCGLTRPEAGHVEWDGQRIEANRTTFGAQLAYFGHLFGLKADLTVRRNLDYASALRGVAGSTDPELLAALGLSECADLEVRHLSAGQARRTALARVLGSGARLWIVDEPFTNLDSDGQQFIEQQFESHIAAGGQLIAATHRPIEAAARNRIEIRLGAPQ